MNENHQPSADGNGDAPAQRTHRDLPNGIRVVTEGDRVVGILKNGEPLDFGVVPGSNNEIRFREIHEDGTKYRWVKLDLAGPPPTYALAGAPDGRSRRISRLKAAGTALFLLVLGGSALLIDRQIGRNADEAREKMEKLLRDGPGEIEGPEGWKTKITCSNIRWEEIQKAGVAFEWQGNDPMIVFSGHRKVSLSKFLWSKPTDIAFTYETGERHSYLSIRAKDSEGKETTFLADEHGEEDGTRQFTISPFYRMTNIAFEEQRKSRFKADGKDPHFVLPQDRKLPVAFSGMTMEEWSKEKDLVLTIDWFDGNHMLEAEGKALWLNGQTITNWMSGDPPQRITYHRFGKQGDDPAEENYSVIASYADGREIGLTIAKKTYKDGKVRYGEPRILGK